MDFLISARFDLLVSETGNLGTFQVLPEGRADKEGIKFGDYIDQVNGENCYQIQQIHNKMRSAHGVLRLRLKRFVFFVFTTDNCCFKFKRSLFSEATHKKTNVGKSFINSSSGFKIKCRCKATCHQLLQRRNAWICSRKKTLF